MQYKDVGTTDFRNFDCQCLYHNTEVCRAPDPMYLKLQMETGEGTPLLKLHRESLNSSHNASSEFKEASSNFCACRIDQPASSASTSVTNVSGVLTVVRKPPWGRFRATVCWSAGLWVRGRC